MSTVLSFLSGRQITDANGDPVDGAKLYHYQANTTNPLTVYNHQDGNPATHAHLQPVPTDVGGFVPVIYIDSASDWKVVITDSLGVVLHTYDLLPKAPAVASSLGFAPPLLQWVAATSAASPVALTAADAGKAYEADTTAGNITFNLPSAASVGNGKGFCFKKMSAANSVVLASNGSEQIEASASDYTILLSMQSVYIISDGANWFAFAIVGDGIIAARLPQASDTGIGAIEIAVQSEVEAASDVLRAVVPGRQQFHPSALKAWVKWNGNTSTIDAGYNVSSITDNGTGDFTLNWTVPFSSANYGVSGLGGGAGGGQRIYVSQNPAAAPTTSAFRVIFFNDAGATVDGVWASVMACGDQ